MRHLSVLAVAAASLFAGIGLSAGPAAARSAPANRADCTTIVNEFRRQGAPAGVAARFGQIAWRESGCRMVCVTDRDDHSCSRLGLNMKGSMPRYWSRLCGASSVNDTKALATDVKCSLAAFRKMGFRPWR